MNLPDSDQLLDTMFRDALQSVAQATPPDDIWPRIADALTSDSLQLQLQPDASEAVADAGGFWSRWIGKVLPPRLLGRVPAWRMPLWHRVASWVHGYETAYPPSTSSLVCLAPDGRCLPSSFPGVIGKQVLDLRLSS